MKLLISFCNQRQEQQNNLIILDTITGTRTSLLEVPASFTGLAQDDDFFYALSQDIKYGMYIIDKKTHQIILHQQLTHTAEPHSLVVIKDTIYIVSTGTDQVLQYKFDREKNNILFERVVWKPENSLGTSDTHHLNSINTFDNNVYVSGFGLKEDNRWSSAKKGYIYNVFNNTKKISNIYHPHSVCIKGSDFYYCESSSRSVKKNKRTLIKLKSGYTRGLSVIDDYIILGTSSGRKRSKSTGLVNNPADQGILEEDCRILIYKKNWWGNYKLMQEINLFPDYTEIYDILTIN